MSLKGMSYAVVPLGAVVFALTGMISFDAVSDRPGRTSLRGGKERRVRPLRERFREEFEKASLGGDDVDADAKGTTRGAALRDESVGERDFYAGISRLVHPGQRHRPRLLLRPLAQRRLRRARGRRGPLAGAGSLHHPGRTGG